MNETVVYIDCFPTSFCSFLALLVFPNASNYKHVSRTRAAN
jgi:hypothetical protein